MSCDDFFPYFVLYNKGKLNGFGFATGSNINSGNVEHPPKSLLRVSIEPIIKEYLSIRVFLSEVGGQSIMIFISTTVIKYFGLFFWMMLLCSFAHFIIMTFDLFF